MEKAFYITIDGQEVLVTEEVYRAYKQPAWREVKRAKTRADKEYSYERMLDDGLEIADAQTLAEEYVADKQLLQMLLSALETLPIKERNIIHALFYEDKTERDVAKELHIAQQTLHSKKIRILAKLRRLIEEK